VNKKVIWINGNHLNASADELAQLLVWMHYDGFGQSRRDEKRIH